MSFGSLVCMGAAEVIPTAYKLKIFTMSQDMKRLGKGSINSDFQFFRGSQKVMFV